MPRGRGTWRPGYGRYNRSRSSARGGARGRGRGRNRSRLNNATTYRGRPRNVVAYVPPRPVNMRWIATYKVDVNKPDKNPLVSTGAAFGFNTFFGNPPGTGLAQGPDFKTYTKLKVNACYMSVLYNSQDMAVLKMDLNDVNTGAKQFMFTNDILENPGGSVLFATEQAINPSGSQKRWKSYWKPQNAPLNGWCALDDTDISDTASWKGIHWFRLFWSMFDPTFDNLTPATTTPGRWTFVTKFDIYFQVASPVYAGYVPSIRTQAERNVELLKCELQMHKDGAIEVIDLTQFDDE